MDREFLESVASLVREVAPETLDKLEAKLASSDVSPDTIRLWTLELPQKSQREALGDFANKWKNLRSPLCSEAVQAVVASQRFTENHRTRAEVCWSGPTDSLQGFRSTNAAYAELMASAKQSILILSFSISDVEYLRTSLEASIERGVKTRLILEDFDVFNQEPNRHRFDLFGPTVLQNATLYTWPTTKRRNQDGRIFGSMHVKCLVVDEEAMLLTSANWSTAAMHDNMELGIVVRDGESVRSVVQHFDHLISVGVLVRL